MPEPSEQTKSLKQIDLRLPGGRFETHYKRETPGVPRCGRCSRELSGIPHSIPSALRRLSASQRKVERIYGGYLCHSCLRNLLKQTVRNTYKP